MFRLRRRVEGESTDVAYDDVDSAVGKKNEKDRKSMQRETFGLCGLLLICIFVIVWRAPEYNMRKMNKDVEVIDKIENVKERLLPDGSRQRDDHDVISAPEVDEVEIQQPVLLEDGSQVFPTKARKLLETLRTNVEERRAELEDQPDYKNAIFDQELDRLKTQVSTIQDVELRASLAFFTRAGHRRRVTDLIGGEPLGPEASRKIIPETTSRFDASKVSESRDYAVNPVRIRRDVNTDSPCDVPCEKCINNCDSSQEEFTMENVIIRTVGLPAYALAATTKLTSRIPVPYFSWHDFGVMRPIARDKLEIRRGQGGLLAAAFISNCGFEKRNNMVRALTKEFGGDRVHSFGSCVNNKVEAHGARGPNGKLDQLQGYKFSLAFENSETNDYVTEKFFGSLAAGSVPLYIGAPNIKFFAPDTTEYPYESVAVLRSKDFSDDATQIAAVIRALESDFEAYKEMLAWKDTGYSDDFKALIDFSDVHSSCRSCISIADERRRVLGTHKYDLRALKRNEGDEPQGKFILYVRERGKYAFTELGFAQSPSIIDLVKRVLKAIRKTKVNLWKDNDDKRPLRNLKRVYALYTIAGRRPVLSDEDVQALPPNAELEVIFV